MNTHIDPIPWPATEPSFDRQIATLLRRYSVACARVADLEGAVDDWVLAAQSVGHRWTRPLPIAASAQIIVAVIDGDVQDVMRELRLAEALRGPRCADPGTCRASVYYAGTIRTLHTHPWSVHHG